MQGGIYEKSNIKEVSVVIGCFNTPVGVVTSLAGYIQKTNYNRTKSAFYSGWKSGKGCVILVYDNEAPYIYAK